MAKTVDQYFDDLQQTRVWRSIFRSGTGSSTLKRALAIQQNVFSAPVLDQGPHAHVELQRDLVSGHADAGNVS